MSNICEICGYEAKTAQGLAGHKQFRHELTGRYERARKLAGSVELLESQETQLRGSIASLDKHHCEVQKQLGELQQQMMELASQKSGLKLRIEDLRQQSDAQIAELAQKMRSQLIQNGWIPPEVDATGLGLAAFLKWASTRQ